MNTRNIIMAAAFLPAMTFAQQASETSADTTFVLNSQHITVSQNGDKTSVTISKPDGTEMRKVSETQFVDGQEVEKIYVNSPFLPTRFARNSTLHRRSKEYSHYPMFYGGHTWLSGSAFGGSSEKYASDSKSSEWGITGMTFAYPLSGSLAITSAISVGQVRHSFDSNYILQTVDGVTSLQPFKGDNEGEKPSKSYLIYWTARVPVMLEWSRRLGGEDVYWAFGPSIEFRYNDRSRYKLGKHKHTVSSDNNMNPVGLNLEARFGYAVFSVYARTALTPLLRTKYAPEWHPFTVGIGIRL